MMKETFTQRIHRLVEEKNIRALLLEAEQLLVIYLNEDDAIDLEPIVSAQSVLQQGLKLFPSQEDQDKEFPVTSVARIDLQEAGIPETVIASLSNEEMETIARKMGDYYCDQGFWDHIAPAVTYIVERREKKR